MESQPGSDPSQSESASGPTVDETKTQSGQDLMDELNHLGSKFVEVIDVAWNSDQRRRVEDDLRKGLESLATALEDGIKQLSENKQARELLDSAEEVAESVGTKVRSSKVANDLADTLAHGLHALSEQMDRLARDMKAKGESATPPASEPSETPQDIPIDRE